MASCATAAGSLTALTSTTAAAAPKGKPFAKLPLRMSMPYGWFKGSPEERLAAAADWGLPGLEWLGPKGDIDELAKASKKTGVKWSCILGAGAISPGHMVQPAQHDAVEKQFLEKIALGKKLGCSTLIGLTGNVRDDVSREEQTKNVITCLKRLAPIAEKNDVTIVMEALNVLVNHKGYFMVTTDHTMEMLKAVDSPNIKMCFDVYHQQISEGNVIRNLCENIDRIGHVHVGDNPGRKEPGSGEINYSNVFKALASTDYKDFVTLECGHTGSVEEALQSTLDCFSWA